MSRSKRYPDALWLSYKDDIRDLYLARNKRLSEVLTELHARGFEVT